MRIPFTVEQFFDVFRQYHEALWPAPLVLYAIAVLAIVVAIHGSPRLSPAVAGILSLLWVWMAGAYHVAFFSAINPAALAFAALFIVQALLFAEAGAMGRLTFRTRADGAGIVGALLVIYALAVYPAIGYAVGHRLPAAPTFGVPCPTTIFTFGMLLWTDGIVPRRLLVIPLLWSAIGLSAAISLGVVQDFALPVAGVVATAIILTANRRLRLHGPADSAVGAAQPS